MPKNRSRHMPKIVFCDVRVSSDTSLATRGFSIDSSTTDSMSKDKGKATKALIPTSPEKKEEKLAE